MLELQTAFACVRLSCKHLFRNEAFSSDKAEISLRLLWEHPLLRIAVGAIIIPLFNLALTEDKSMKSANINFVSRAALLLVATVSIAFAAGCADTENNSNTPATTIPATSASPAVPTTTTPANTASPAATPSPAATSPSPKIAKAKAGGTK